MKNLSLTFCLTIAALLASVGSGFAEGHLPKCSGSPLFKPLVDPSKRIPENWTNCQGTVDFGTVRYVGEWKNGRYHGQGTEFFDWGYVTGVRGEGAWGGGTFAICRPNKKCKTKVIPSSIMNKEFLRITKQQRKLVQSKLKTLGLYSASIDGLFGVGTDNALHAYNQKICKGSDLKISNNAMGLINSVLGFQKCPPQEINPKFAIKPTQKSQPKISPRITYEVASGTGFYVSDQGHIITNHHVIEGCENMKIQFRGNVLETKKLAEDRKNDLALLKISATPEHSFALSNESSFPLQDIVVAGFPFGHNVSSSLKFTQGIVSATAGIGDDDSQIQIDAALQPGNSGGPILDEFGNVVAVAVAKLSLKKILKDYGVVPENTHFGVKASAVRNLMEGNGISFKSPNTEVISKRELSQVATDGTVYLTCWMTTAQIEQMRARKVLFEDLK